MKRGIRGKRDKTLGSYGWKKRLGRINGEPSEGLGEQEKLFKKKIFTTGL